MANNFRVFLEKTAEELFGIKNNSDTKEDNPPIQYPIKGFDVELMMELLSRKRLGVYLPKSSFLNEIQWGTQPGAIKLEVDTGYTFFIKKLTNDKTGEPRWITKKALQLNRNGFGGKEDLVAQEIYDNLNSLLDENLEFYNEKYEETENLTKYLYDKMISSAKTIFFPEGIKKINDDAYIIKFGVKGQGLEFRDQQRIEQNQTLINYDKNLGTIRITNYNLLSPVGKAHEFNIGKNDLDVYFMPSQSMDEIANVLCVHMRYY